jgi:NADPH:quinone reductase-like Zn-dependent oxidoreductase
MPTIEVLTCRRPSRPADLVVERQAMPRPRGPQVCVEVKAAGVNPIDVKRAAGYGRRLLGLKGAGRFPQVLGNDFAGIVREVGPRAGDWRPGEPVFGLLPMGPQGSHAGAVLADARWLRRVPPGADLHRLAALPYSFTTTWLTLKAARLTPQTAAGRRVLVHGASGALGRLALHLLVQWGARVTAVSGPGGLRDSLALGAEQAVDRLLVPLSQLPTDFDASLNFAAWEDDAALLARLHAGALGHATTVHPLLENVDRLGWMGGLIASAKAFRAQRRRLKPHGGKAGYRWVVFRPDGQALDELQRWAAQQPELLPLGLAVPLDQADRAFEHVLRRQRGRALLLPAAPIA